MAKRTFACRAFAARTFACAALAGAAYVQAVESSSVVLAQPVPSVWRSPAVGSVHVASRAGGLVEVDMDESVCLVQPAASVWPAARVESVHSVLQQSSVHTGVGTVGKVSVTITKHSLDLRPDTVSLENQLKPNLTLVSAGTFVWHKGGVVTSEVAAGVTVNSSQEVSRGDGTTAVAANKGLKFTWTSMGSPGATYIGKGTFVDSANGAQNPGALTVVLRVTDDDG